MDSWIIPFVIFIIFDVAVLIKTYLDDKEKNKFNHDLPNIEPEDTDDDSKDATV